MFKRPDFLRRSKPDDSPAAAPDHMDDALTLVREGRLQEATNLLLGRPPCPAEAPAAPAASTPPIPGHGLSSLAARGLANVRAVFRSPQVKPEPTPMPLAPNAFKAPPDASAPPTQATGQASAGTAGAATGRFEQCSFKHGGVDHTYWLYTPLAEAPAHGRPLVLMLHGCTQDARNFARGTRMNTVAETAGSLVLYPTQSKHANANGCWNWFRPEDQQAGAGEPALLLAMVAHAIATQTVDRKRVYVAGLSAGGAMAAVLAQQHPEVFAAVGVHSGLVAGAANNMMGALSAMRSGAKGWSAPASQGHMRPVPMIVVHGDADATVHQRNGEQLFQGAANGTNDAVHTTEQGVSADGQRYTRTSVVDPAAHDTVVAEHWLLHGAGHAWSGGDASGSYASAHGVDASGEMLRFFLTHQKTDFKAPS